MTEDGGTSALLGVYGDPTPTLVAGEGCRVRDDRGRTYLDFTAGIAVNALGYGAPQIRRALLGALETGLIHTSNLFRTGPAEELARLLVERSFPGRVFFCNSGAEANEAAFKFARRWAGATHGRSRAGFVAFHGSFHGRLFGSLAATDRPAYREPFEPLMPGVVFADVEDAEGVRAILEEGRTAAVIVEPVQGEGGIRPVPPSSLAALRQACTDTGTLLIADEVQCGLGRTGRAFAWQHADVRPDVMTLAKPLGGGLPMGAVVVSEEVAATVRPGDHATTFGGGPLVSAVALAVVRTVTEPEFLAEVRRKGQLLRAGLESLGRTHAGVKEVRGLGLMLGAVVDGRAADVVRRAREEGLLVVGAGPDVVRFVPPLLVDDDEIAEAVRLFGAALSTHAADSA